MFQHVKRGRMLGNCSHKCTDPKAWIINQKKSTIELKEGLQMNSTRSLTMVQIGYGRHKGIYSMLGPNLESLV